MKISAAAFVAALIATAGLADAAAVKCANGVSYRRDFRDLSQTEWDKFVGALKTLNTKPSTRFVNESLSTLEAFSRLHVEHFKEIHTVFEPTDDPNKPANSVFLPWHRQFILELEQELQKIDPTVTLPYWHQGIDADAPEKSFLFSAERLGGSAPLAAGEESGCVPNGPLAGLQHKMYGCVRRGFQPDGRISVELMEDMMPEPYNNKVTYKARLPTAQEIDMFVRDTKEWSKFTDNMEFVYHSVAHLFVGGNKHGTMNRPFSPMDWTFFLHHGYVDYVWSRWQEVHPGSHDFGSKPLPGYGSLTGASVANREELCYQYLPPGALNPKPVPPATTTTTTTTTKTTTTTSTTTTTTSAVPTTTTTTSARTTTTSAATTTTSSAVPTTTSSTAATTTTKAADKSTTSSAATTTTAASSSTKADDKKSTTATTTSAAGSTTTTAASSTTATTTSVPSSSSAATSSAWTSSAADKTSTKQGHTTTTAASGTTTASTASSTSDATTATEPAYGKRKSTTSTTSLSATKTQESTTAATESATKTEAEQSTSSTTAAATTEPVYGKRPAGDKKPEAGKPTATYDDGYPIITPAPAKPGKPARPAAPAVYVPKKPGYPVPPADFPGYILRPIPSKGRVMPLMNKAMLKNMGYSEKRVKQCQEYMRKIEKKVEAKVKAGEWVPSFGQTEETRELLGSLYTTEVQGTDNSTAAIATAHKAEKSAATKSSSWAVTGVFGAVAAIALMN